MNNVPDPGITVGLTIFVALMAITLYGVYMAFGEPSKELTDPFDEHED